MMDNPFCGIAYLNAIRRSVNDSKPVVVHLHSLPSQNRSTGFLCILTAYGRASGTYSRNQ